MERELPQNYPRVGSRNKLHCYLVSQTYALLEFLNLSREFLNQPKCCLFLQSDKQAPLETQQLRTLRNEN